MCAKIFIFAPSCIFRIRLTPAVSRRALDDTRVPPSPLGAVGSSAGFGGVRPPLAPPPQARTAPRWPPTCHEQRRRGEAAPPRGLPGGDHWRGLRAPRTPAVSRRALEDALEAQTAIGAVGSTALFGPAAHRMPHLRKFSNAVASRWWCEPIEL
jgi:hypothetical protein